MTEPIDVPFELWTRGWPKEAQVKSYLPGGTNVHSFNHIRQVAPMYPHRRAHWHYLMNTIQLSVCGGDAVLCQITLTTCFITSAIAEVINV